MGVRVRVSIKYGDAALDLVALVNTGYETDVPEILIPDFVAEKIGIFPRLPDGTIVETYKTAAGLMKAYRVDGASTALLIEGTEAREVGTYVVSEYADEP
jgi:hypothetical protein